MEIILLPFGIKMGVADLESELQKRNLKLYKVKDEDEDRLKIQIYFEKELSDLYAIVFADNLYLMHGNYGVSDSTPDDPWAANVTFACIKINNQPPHFKKVGVILFIISSSKKPTFL